MKPKKIIKMRNQMVAVFDKDDQQLPYFQGWIGDVLPKLLVYLTQKQVDELKYSAEAEISL